MKSSKGAPAWARCVCRALALLVISTLFVRAAAAEVFLFDMGSGESPLRDGFTRVTARSTYEKKRGFGWKHGNGLREHVKHYSRKWTFNESRGRKQPPPIYTNEITCDTIFSREPNEFLIDLKPGDYTVYVLCGRSAGSRAEYHDFDILVGGDGSGDRATVKIPGPYRFEQRRLNVTLRGRQLAVRFEPRTDWLVACLVVFPATGPSHIPGRDLQVPAMLEQLQREVYFLPPDVAEQWHETKHVETRPMPPFSRRDRDRGYAVFARHWSEVIYPNTAPRPEELDPELKLFAAWDEYEPVTFTVRPLRDLRDAEVHVSDLRCGDAVIPARDIDCRSVRYMLVRPNYSSFFSYHIAPDVLERCRPMDLSAGRNQRYWLTVHVPPDAPPGVYQGTITFRAADTPPARLPIRLRVLPIRLQKNPHHIYGMYYRDPLRYVSDRNHPVANAYFRRKAELERQDMVAHGMNSHISSVSGLERDENGNWTMDGTETERRIALDRKYGLAGKPMVVSLPVTWWYSRLVDPKGPGSHLRLVRSDVPQSFFDEVTKMVRAVEKEKKKYDWPEFLYYPIDEPGRHEAAVNFMVGVLKAIKRVPGVRTYVTADPTHEQFQPMWPYVDVWCCQPFVYDYDTIRRLSREKGIEFWCYPNHIAGENDHTPVRGARMTWGFGFWKSGFRTLTPWIYQADIGDPWNYLDGTAMDFMNRSTPDGEPIPVTLWEAYREGIDDGRYIYTLEQLVDESKKRGGRAAELARQAAKELAFVWDAIVVQEKYKYDGLWSGRDFDAWRWLLASQILRLLESLERE